MGFQWHPDLHRELGKERLCFWRIGFAPTYNRADVKKTLEDLFKDLEVHSYAFYEMIGIHDLMLRVWLPTSIPLGKFGGKLREALGSYELVGPDYFAVDEMLMHWVWTDKEGSQKPVDPGVLSKGLPDDIVASINDGLLPSKDLKSYQRLNVVAPSSHGAGIKFFIIVTTGLLPTEWVDTHPSLSDQIAEILNRAKAVTEKSLYTGSGRLGQFLVMGKVKTSQFAKIFTELMEPINELGLSHDFRARTYTHICTKGLVQFIDILPPWQTVLRESDVRPIEEYLEDEESRVLEVKGSAFVNVVRWMNTKKAGLDDQIVEEILRSIAGMLNADGGTIVVGALEMRPPFVEANEPGESLQDCPRFKDRYIIFGVEQDYRAAGATKDWDAFLQRLNRKIRERIDPLPSPWVTIERRVFLDKTMAVISVRDPDSGWFYLRKGGGDPGEFHVRQENETNIMGGTRADEYKKAKGRI